MRISWFVMNTRCIYQKLFGVGFLSVNESKLVLFFDQRINLPWSDLTIHISSVKTFQDHAKCPKRSLQDEQLYSQQLICLWNNMKFWSEWIQCEIIKYGLHSSTIAGCGFSSHSPCKFIVISSMNPIKWESFWNIFNVDSRLDFLWPSILLIIPLYRLIASSKRSHRSCWL